MSFNAMHLTITCKTSPICVIQQNNSAKCLSIIITDRPEHITNISNKAISISELSCSETQVNANSQSSQPVKQHNYIYVSHSRVYASTFGHYISFVMVTKQ